MHTKVEVEKDHVQNGVKRYPIQYAISDYTFPSPHDDLGSRKK